MSDMDKYFGNPRRKYWLFLLIPLGIAAFALVMGYLVMWLWNAILPDVLGVRSINYWQAIGILALSRILFGGFGGKGGGRGNKWRHKGRKFRAKGGMFRERWMQMSEEERARFKQEWQDRCGRRD